MLKWTAARAWNNFWSGIWICFLSSTMLQTTYAFYVMLISCTSLTNHLGSKIIANLSDLIIVKLFLTELSLTNYIKSLHYLIHSLEPGTLDKLTRVKTSSIYDIATTESEQNANKWKWKRETETQLWRRLGEMCLSCFLSDTFWRVSLLVTDWGTHVLLQNYHSCDNARYLQTTEKQS